MTISTFSYLTHYFYAHWFSNQSAVSESISLSILLDPLYFWVFEEKVFITSFTFFGFTITRFSSIISDIYIWNTGTSFSTVICGELYPSNVWYLGGGVGSYPYPPVERPRQLHYCKYTHNLFHKNRRARMLCFSHNQDPTGKEQEEQI